MEIHYFIRKGSTVSGPMTAHALKELAMNGSLTADNEISQDRSHWVRAGDVRGLRFGLRDAEDADRAFDVFISYSKYNKLEADVICGKLEAKGIRCWVAPRDIMPGTEWTESIIDGIERSRVMVLVFSEHANNSSQVRREVERSISKEIPVIPFRVENVMPARSLEYCLGNTHWFDAFDPPLDTHVDRLAAVIKRLLTDREQLTMPGASTPPLVQVIPMEMRHEAPKPAPVMPVRNEPPVAAPIAPPPPLPAPPVQRSRRLPIAGVLLAVVLLAVAIGAYALVSSARKNDSLHNEFTQARTDYDHAKSAWDAAPRTAAYDHSKSAAMAKDALETSETSPASDDADAYHQAITSLQNAKAKLEWATMEVAVEEQAGQAQVTAQNFSQTQARQAYDMAQQQYVLSRQQWRELKVSVSADHVKSNGLYTEATRMASPFASSPDSPDELRHGADAYRAAAAKVEEAINQYDAEQLDDKHEHDNAAEAAAVKPITTDQQTTANRQTDDGAELTAGIAAYNANNYSQSLAHLRTSAAAGNDGAMNWLGFMYRFGHGVTTDNAQALAWYRKAADAGNVDAMNSVGIMYQKGLGVPRDYVQALTWYSKAAGRNNAAAMDNLGDFYQNGWGGVTRDYDQAMTWYRKSADAGNATAMDDIGDLYRNGRGVDQDYAQAMTWYRKAADGGNIDAPCDIANLYHSGQGVAKDDVQALEWYRKAADLNNSGAMVWVGYFYEHALGGLTCDYSTAMNWYRKASEGGSNSGLNNIGWLYQNGLGVTTDYNQAMTWYQKAAAGGDTDAMSNLGDLYAQGHGVPQDYAQAMTWYRKAADAGDTDAQCNIGNLYHNGQGVTKDDDEALTWYRKAADGRNAIAMCWLGYYYDQGLGSIKQDYDQAMSWYEKSFDGGDAAGGSFIANLYLNGHGVTADRAEAVKWYHKAADAGDQSAKDWLSKNGG